MLGILVQIRITNEQLDQALRPETCGGVDQKVELAADRPYISNSNASYDPTLPYVQVFLQNPGVSWNTLKGIGIGWVLSKGRCPT